MGSVSDMNMVRIGPMSPNPTTVYAEEFDRVEQAGGGPREEGDDEFNEPFAVGSHGEGCGLAVDLPGGSDDDSVQSDLDTGPESLDNVNHANRIVNLELDCQKYEAAWHQSRKQSKLARNQFEAATERLRGYIRALSIPMPLFDGGSNDSPAGEPDMVDGELPVGGGTQDQGDSPLDGPTDVLTSPGQIVEERAGMDERSRRRRSSNQAVGQGLSESPAADEGDDEGWKAAQLGGIFPAAIAKKFEAEGIRTVGELSTFLISGKTYSDIQGVGPTRQAQVEVCLEAFWAKWEAGN